MLWANPFTGLRLPKIFNLRTHPYERADVTSNTYYDWIFDHVFLLVRAQDYVGQFLASFREYPQRQKAASFNLDEVGEAEGGELTRRLTLCGPTLRVIVGPRGNVSSISRNGVGRSALVRC